MPKAPFVLDMACAAEKPAGTGPDLLALTAATMAAWPAFAHRGDPSNPLLPAWPRYGV